MTMMTIARSEAWLARARGLIPALTQTLAKGPGQHVRGVAPSYLLRGKGCRVEDVDGNRFLDLTMAVGPLILGYAHEAVDRAIARQLADGITFSLMHPLEIEVAERMRELVPCAEMVRFSKTGADVTSAAIRLARAYTRRDHVVCCGYHGWHDWYVATTPRAAGVPSSACELTHTFAYNDLDSVLAAVGGDTACVILEPVVFEPPAPGFLEELRSICRTRGALLIFDEMWTGFRAAIGGAQERFGVTPDLATFSKAIANGMPLSALAGRGDVMRLLEREVFFFTTFGGEALSLAAAAATLDEIARLDVPAELARRGAVLRAGIEELLRARTIDWVRCVGLDCRTMLVFEDRPGADPLVQRSLVQQELLRRGILWHGFHNLSSAHGDDEIATVLAAYGPALDVLAAGVRGGDAALLLEGEPAEPVFRKTSGFHGKPRRIP
jgi:glutamate-1-semialdehyde aminotransferase